MPKFMNAKDYSPNHSTKANSVGLYSSSGPNGEDVFLKTVSQILWLMSFMSKQVPAQLLQPIVAF